MSQFNYLSKATQILLITTMFMGTSLDTNQVIAETTIQDTNLDKERKDLDKESENNEENQEKETSEEAEQVEITKEEPETPEQKTPELQPDDFRPEILKDEQPLEVEKEVIEKITDFIDNTDFENIIDVFSTSLFGDVPKNDTFYGQKYELTDLEGTYNKIKNDSLRYAQFIVQVNAYKDYNQDKVKQQLVLLSYFMRWGDFSNGKHTFWNELYAPQSSFLTTEQAKALNDLLISLFIDEPEKYLTSKNVTSTFEKVFKDLKINKTYKQNVEHFLNQNGVSDYSQWFYKTFKGKMLKDHYEGTTYDVGIWNRSKYFVSFLPYLLNLSDKTNLIIGETRGEIVLASPYNYDKDPEKGEQVVRNAMKVITNTLELYDSTIVDKDLMNVDKIMGQRAIQDQGRNWLNPEDSLSYEIYRVAGFTLSHNQNGAIGGSGLIQMQATKMESSSVISHELAHELDGLFDANSEYYSTYNYNPGRNRMAGLNTFADEKEALNKNTITNTSTKQMQTKADLVSYAKNMEDMVYVLDGIVATKVLELPLKEQVKYIKLAYVDGINGSLLSDRPDSETIQAKDLTVDELEKLNIKTIEDLIENNAVLMQPSDTNKNILRNHGQGYGTTLTYSAFFLSNGKPFHHNHRIINTLLSKDGWEGFKIFNKEYNRVISEIKDDEDLSTEEKIGIASLSSLKKAYKDESISYRKLIAQRYSEAMKSFKDKGLLGGTYEEILRDMSSIDLSNFYDYKYKMMSNYLNLTGEFSNPAFGYDENLKVNVKSYTELFETIQVNPNADIVLTQDFEVDGKYVDQELPEFTGVLNGKGHTISKASHPLFTQLRKAQIKNLLLNEINILSSGSTAFGGLSNDAKDSKIDNVHIIHSKILTSNTKDNVSSGGILGNSTNSQILNSSVQETEVSGAFAGGIVGKAEGSNLLNIYSTGKLNNSKKSSDLRIGGIVGIAANTEIKNTYSTMDITEGNGVLGSNYSGGVKPVKVEDSVSLSNVNTSSNFKFFSKSDTKQVWKNNFEIKEYTGTTSQGIDNLDVTSISSAEVNQGFFKEKLTWGSDPIWNINGKISSTNLPYLNNDDPRNGNENPIQGGDITVHYQDEGGSELFADVVLSGKVGEQYVAEEKRIEGYMFKEVRGTPSGNFTEGEQEVTFIYEKNAVTFNNFKNGYWRDYGFILEGESGSTDMDLSTKDKVIHQVELVTASNQVVKTWKGTPTNWYGDKSQFNGYQVILTSIDLGLLSSGAYTLRVRTTEKSTNKEVVSGIQEVGNGLGLLSFIGDMSGTISGLDKGTSASNTISFSKDNSGMMTLNVATGKITFNKISQYEALSGNEIIDGWIAIDFDFRTNHTKELVIKNSSGSEIFRKVAPTWDIKQTFKVDVKDEWKCSGFQANIPADMLKNGNKYFVVIKDQNNNEVSRIEIY